MKARPNIGKLIVTAPVFVAKGTDESTNSATHSYGLPAGMQVNDIMVLAIESGPGDTITPPVGWAEVTGSPRVDGSSTTQCNLWWKRHSGSESSPSVGLTGDHQIGYILAIRGCTVTGNPWDDTGIANGAAGTSQSIGSGLTTTVEKCLCYIFAANGHDSSTTTYYSAWNAGTLGGAMTERGDFHAIDGTGGGIGCAEGVKTTTGNVGIITSTIIDAETTANICVAFKPLGT
jgi:hypothetical protein